MRKPFTNMVEFIETVATAQIGQMKLVIFLVSKIILHFVRHAQTQSQFYIVLSLSYNFL